MKWRLALTPQADRDIGIQFEYIAKDNLEAAVRFYEAAFRAFDVLQTNPHIGPARYFENPQLKDIRIWFVGALRNTLSSIGQRMSSLRSFEFFIRPETSTGS